MAIIQIVGVDCSTNPKRVGLSRAILEPGGSARVQQVRVCSIAETPEALVAAWLKEEPNSLLALDAPLGWPAPLGPALSEHRAGEPIEAERRHLFDRETDRVVHQRYRVKPLSVGANLIAHTAHAALDLLARLRLLTGRTLPLAWEPGLEIRPAAIEVYPAATLASRGLPHRGSDKVRAACSLLANELRLPEGLELSTVDEHALDSLICLLGGLDFLVGQACPPGEQLSTARREGWIWVRRSG